MRALLLAAALLAPLPALAHPGHGLEHGFAAGLAHPFLGLDHLLAMVTVGLLGGLLGGAARFALPGAFLAAMAAGAGLAMAGVALPGVEAGILASLIVLGALTALAVRLPLGAMAGLAALFGLLHGAAHGAELPGGSAALYVAGFLVATAALHGLGLALARPFAPWARRAAQLAGGATAAAGLALALVG
ncbi:HupE/UreJ family protein [Siccirubricoccus sp. KC 17139]|uniref:HupE/UreJ family protein n=1 Tax=Siccirubricoccus soli TaxID=2899147 RepID=A0ABT1DBQ4_9PROT|nr:HupE/UreJ family protein [Siccirubricoccus soli]MCO6419378.1 HupE/UreJ family protein [Siccirubricoccus soli]MCP2685513.1 HupE/UreJ family protein [Siccirubricoccus soli]